MTDDDTLNMIGDMLAAVREPGERDMAITIATHAHSADCPNGYFSVHLNGHTSSAKNLTDAIRLVRAKVARGAEKGTSDDQA